MKKILLMSFLSLISLFLISCKNKTTKIEKKETDNPLSNYQVKLKTFDYSNIELLDGIFKDVYDGTKDYYLSMSADDLLYGMRSYLHLDTKTGKDLNMGVGGNVMGQLISAAAKYSNYLKTEEAINRAKDLCDGLYEINQLSPIFIDGNTTYAFEKYLTGCLDLYNYCGLEKGLEMAKRMVEYAMNSSAFNNPTKALGNNGPDNEIEWYTMGESLYYFSETCKEAGYPALEVKKYRDFAKKYDYTEFWDIFYNDHNIFDYSPEVGQNTKYFHAYSHLNSFNSALKAYEVTNNSYYLDSANKFYEWFKDEEMISTGGYGAHVEWLSPKYEILDYIRYYHDNYETQCDTYAVYRMTNYLTKFSGTSQYGDWVEKLLYNAVIASLETEDGYPFYYSDYSVSGGEKELRLDWQWACCAGSRPLIVNEVLKTIYYNDTENIYVNQFINSKVNFTNKDNEEIVIKQETEFPENGIIKLTVEKTSSKEYSIKFRIPSYAKNVKVSVNSNATDYIVDGYGWASIRRNYQENDVIEISFDYDLEISTMQAVNQYGDEDGIFLVNVGPVVLCANMVHGMKTSSFITYSENISDQLIAGKDKLHYTSKQNSNVEFKPYYEYVRNETYYMFFNMYQNELFE